jgi:hypothetical protein
MLPIQKPKPKLNTSRQNSTFKIARVIYSTPASLRWIFAVLLLLLVFSTGGLLLLKSFTGLSQTNFPSLNKCSAFFQEENILSWKIKNYGKPGNMGTLEIKAIDSKKGKWEGNQINETNNNIKTKMIGTFNSSTMSLLHPSGVEKWMGICKDRKIEGFIKTTYNSQLTFEMQ